VCSLLLFIIYYNLVAPRKLETRVYNIISVIVTKNGTDKIQNVQPIVICYDAYYMYNVYIVLKIANAKTDDRKWSDHLAGRPAGSEKRIHR